MRQYFAGAVVLLVGIAALAAPAPPSVSAAPANRVVGIWVTPKGASHVRIFRERGRFVGRIIWLKQPDYPSSFHNRSLAGGPKVDLENPKPALRDRPVMGLEVLRGFRYQPRKHDWRDGRCYDPKTGKTYHCRMWLKDHGNVLKVRGYVWIFHRTETWHRFRGRPPKRNRTEGQTKLSSNSVY